MFGQGFNSPQLHQRFEPRLKAIQKTGSTAQVPLPFSLARPLPRSPLRSADGHRNRDAIVPRYFHISAFPIGNRYSVADSVRSLQLPSAPPRNGSRFICRLPVFFLRGGAVGSAPLLLAFVKQTGCTPLCSALALRRGTTHVSGSPFAFFRASCRSHTKEVSFVPFGAKSSQNSLPDTSWFRLNSITLKGTCLCG